MAKVNLYKCDVCSMNDSCVATEIKPGTHSKRRSDGLWNIVTEDGTVIASGYSHYEAWRDARILLEDIYRRAHMTSAQLKAVEAIREAKIEYLDADGKGVVRLNGKTINGNLVHSLILAGILERGVKPNSTRWRYTVIKEIKCDLK